MGNVLVQESTDVSGGSFTLIFPFEGIADLIWNYACKVAELSQVNEGLTVTIKVSKVAPSNKGFWKSFESKIIFFESKEAAQKDTDHQDLSFRIRSGSSFEFWTRKQKVEGTNFDISNLN